MSSVLASIQQEIADWLLADPFFAAIPVLVENPRDVSYELQSNAAAAGIYAVVLVPQAEVAAPNAPGPIFDPVEIVVQVRENVPVASGPHALEVAEAVLALTHLYRPATVNEVLFAAPHALERMNDGDGVAYQVRLRTQAGAGYDVPRLDAPEIVDSGSHAPQDIALTSAQPGAAIFYTLDGSQPAPRSPTSILYTAPFTVSTPALLRSRAWLAGYLASTETRKTYA